MRASKFKCWFDCIAPAAWVSQTIHQSFFLFFSKQFHIKRRGRGRTVVTLSVLSSAHVSSLSSSHLITHTCRPPTSRWRHWLTSAGWAAAVALTLISVKAAWLFTASTDSDQWLVQLVPAECCSKDFYLLLSLCLFSETAVCNVSPSLFLADSTARVCGFQRHHEAGVCSVLNPLLVVEEDRLVQELVWGSFCCHQDLPCKLSRPRVTLSVNYLTWLSW